MNRCGIGPDHTCLPRSGSWQFYRDRILLPFQGLRGLEIEGSLVLYLDISGICASRRGNVSITFGKVCLNISNFTFVNFIYSFIFSLRMVWNRGTEDIMQSRIADGKNTYVLFTRERFFSCISKYIVFIFSERMFNRALLNARAFESEERKNC